MILNRIYSLLKLSSVIFDLFTVSFLHSDISSIISGLLSVLSSAQHVEELSISLLNERTNECSFWQLKHFKVGKTFLTIWFEGTKTNWRRNWLASGLELESGCTQVSCILIHTFAHVAYVLSINGQAERLSFNDTDSSSLYPNSSDNGDLNTVTSNEDEKYFVYTV